MILLWKYQTTHQTNEWNVLWYLQVITWPIINQLCLFNLPITRAKGSVVSTKFNRFQLKKFKCDKINSIENQHFSFLSDSIFHKEKQKNRQMRQNQNKNPLTN